MKRKRIYAIFVVAVLAILSVSVTACHGKGGGVAPEPETHVYGITISNAVLSLEERQQADLSAQCTKDGAIDAAAEITWETSDAAVATVSDGTVTAVAQGTAVITATYMDKTATCTVTVIHIEPALVLSKAALQMRVGDTEQLTVTVTGMDAPDSYEWSSLDDEVASVINGLVTAEGAGSTTVTVSATVGSETYTDECEVTVSDFYDITASVTGEGDGNGDYYAGRNYALDYTVNHNGSPMVGAEAQVTITPSAAGTYDSASKQIQLNDAFAGGEVTVRVAYKDAEQKDIANPRDVTIDVYHAISNVTDFSAAFWGALDTGKRGYWYKLTADIDCSGQSAQPAETWSSMDAEYFHGVLDGNGHAIKNVKPGAKAGSNDRSVLGFMSNGAIVRNVAFIGVEAENRSGIVASVYGATFENVFVEVKYNGAIMGSVNGNNPPGAIACKINTTSVVKNCVTLVTFVNAPAQSYGLIAGKTTASAKVENCYSYTNSLSNAALISANQSTSSATADVNTFNAVGGGAFTMVSSLVSSVRDEGKLAETGLWTITDGEIPTLKDVSLEESGFTASGPSALAPGEGGTVTVSGNTYPVEYFITSGGFDGISIDPGSGAITFDAAATGHTGSTVTVTARSVVSSETAECNITIAQSYTNNITVPGGTEYTVNYVIGYDDDSEYKIEASADEGDVTFAVAPESERFFTIGASDGAITVTETTDNTVREPIEVTLSADNAANVVVTVTLVVYKPITSVEDFNNITNDYPGTTSNVNGNYMLMNDIDGDGAKWITLAGYKWYGDKFDYGYTGIFDGNGHTISNITPTTDRSGGNTANNVAPFGTIQNGGIVRNVAFKGVNITNTIGAGIANACRTGGLIENCYAEVSFSALHTGKTNSSGGIAAKVEGGTIRNCIAKVSSTASANTTHYGSVAGNVSSGGKIENCFGIGYESNIVAPENAAEATSLIDSATKAFADSDAFFADGEADVSGFDTDIWNIVKEETTIGLKPGCTYTGHKTV